MKSRITKTAMVGFTAVVTMAAATIGGVVCLRTVSASPAQPAAPYAEMKLVFEDKFDGTTLDTKKWFCGPKPDGGQWGGAHFVSADEPQFKDVYHVENGMLRIRAFHNDAYTDPEGWGRKWYSGQLSTAFPDGRASGSTREGYFTARMKISANPGAWSAFWMNNVDSIKNGSKSGGVEIDVVEGYGHYTKGYVGTIHDWPAPGEMEHSQGKHFDGMLGGSDTSNDFHDYGLLLTATEAVWFFDNKEMVRFPLYRMQTVGPFYALLDLAISQDWPVTIPASGHVDIFVDEVRIYSAE